MDGAFSILLIPLLAGYILNHSLPFVASRVKNHTGHHLLISSLITGLLLLLPFSYYAVIYIFPGISTTCVNAAKDGVPEYCGSIPYFETFWDFFYTPLREQIHQLNQREAENVLKASLLSLGISIVVCIFSWFFAIIISERFLSKIRRSADRRSFANRTGSLGDLILHSIKEGHPILFSLRSRKVYVGYVTDVPRIRNSDKWNIKVLPLHSGYRTDKELGLQLDNSYKPFLDAIKYFPGMEAGKALKTTDLNGAEVVISYEEARNLANNFGIVLSWDDIESASVWIPELYHSFKRNS